MGSRLRGLRALSIRFDMNTVYHQIDNSSGSVINLRAPGVKYHELAEVSSRGKTSLAQVIKLEA